MKKTTLSLLILTLAITFANSENTYPEITQETEGDGAGVAFQAQ